MELAGRYYSEGFSDGQREVYCELLCHGFDERLLQRLFSISEEDMHIITSQAADILRQS